MAVRGDDVANAIEAHVREGIEKMVAEIRSSIEDVREAVDSQLKAALQSVQADLNAVTFLPQIKKSIGELEPEAAPIAIEPPASAGTGDTTRLKQAIRGVEGGKSQVDVLNGLLEQALTFGSRAALLILRGETFSGWKGLGFSAHGGNDENVKRFNAAPGLLPELDNVLRNEQVVVWDGANLATRLGVGNSSKAVLIPMVIKDKVAAAVYVDATEEDLSKLDVASLQILVFATGLLIDTLAIRKKIPSPSLTEASETGSETMMAAPPIDFAPEPPPPPRPAPPPPPAPAPPPPRPAPAPAPAAAPTSATVAIPAMSFTPQPAAPAPAPPPRPAAAPPAPRPAAPAAGASALTGDERPSTQYIPPAGVGRGASSAQPATEESKKHDDARRFARLLVSEIKLYNEAKVDQGRKNKDLYERLKEDIDRSRQMYDERIGEDVRKGSNYFYDELVRILADGDAGVLGL